MLHNNYGQIIQNRFRSELMRTIVAIVAICFSLNGWAQSYAVKGKVTDNNGQPIPGATVQVAGTSLGTTANVEGDFSLNVSGNVKITFSAVGYSTVTREVSSSQSIVNVSLREDQMNLDEVVVTGSTIRAERRQLGNAITTIKADNLEKTGSPNLVSALQGKIPGAQITQNSGDPAGGITVRLRGVKSIQGSSDPLYVIDGVIINNETSPASQLALSLGNQAPSTALGTNRLADINPSDIESLNVINGAAAAAQYGSRAANGVVIITTKRGKSGAPKINFTTSFSSNELRKGVFISTLGKQFGFKDLRLHTIGVISAAQSAANPTMTTTGIVRDGATSLLASNLVDVTRYNYFDQIFRTGFGNDNTLSISGGTDRTQYFVSASYMKNEGIVKGVDFRRASLRARVDQRLNNWAKLSAGLNYSNSFSNEKANGNVFYSPINSVTITNNIYDITQRDAAGNLLAVEPTRVNPLTTVETMKFTQAVSRTIADAQLNLTPIKGLGIDWVVGVDTYGQLGKNYIPPYPYQAVAGLPAERYPDGFAANANNNVTQFNSDINATYETELSSSLKLNAAAGFNYQFYQSDFTRASGLNTAPFIETVSGTASTTVTAGYGLDRYNLSGFFVQATLGYKNLAFVTAAVRRDRSSKFSPSETNQTYPKLSGSFVVSDLDIWKNSSLANIWDGFKVRASYGQAGNLTGIGSYSRFWQFSPVPFLGKNTIIPGATLANPRVRPERMDEIEVGADLSFLKSRLNLGISVYNQQIKDLVVNRELAPSTGGTGIVNNVGTMENKGFEISLNALAVKKKDFSADFTVLYNQNRNKVLDIDQGNPLVSTLTIGNSAGAPVFLIEGQPASVFYGFPYARNADGSLLLTSQNLPQRERGTQDANDPTKYTISRAADGQPSGAFVRTVIGNPNPKWTGSFSGNLTYKKLGFRFLLDAVQGFQVFNADKRTRNNVGIGDIAEAEMLGTLPRGYVFSLVNIEEYRVDEGGFTKLRELALTYQLPKFKGISNWSVSLVGRNLISWDKYNGFDPETNAGNNSDILRGVDFGNVPIPRTYQLQLNLSF
ncbi:SusC/RagA family TonB-linked outer membrane protein [Runella sp. SP2]|uniref:SusC/RagA family TonB-linked outer membrane protein n=1 Tax=Runella sp. SP2 TaxID=2268026 RepID=UPI000F07F918|nr:SusC/RagA family TonB-linked outer membrane protein [Runella sp. SP2]AYQ34973.1 SusC/RagA family TonB-linked outer membrane protein [Runella sp. SP2]